MVPPIRFKGPSDSTTRKNQMQLANERIVQYLSSPFYAGVQECIFSKEKFEGISGSSIAIDACDIVLPTQKVLLELRLLPT